MRETHKVDAVPVWVRESRLAVVVSNWVENIECYGWSIDGYHAMRDAAGDPPLVAWSQASGDAADGEIKLARDEIANLFVRVGVVGHGPSRLKGNHREHHPLTGGRADGNTREKRVVGTGPRRAEVTIGQIRFGSV